MNLGALAERALVGMTTRLEKGMDPDTAAKLDTLKKGLSLSDFTGDAGLMNALQANEFLREIIEQPTLLAAIDTATMREPTMDIDRIGYLTRVSKPIAETADITTESEPTAASIKLSTTEYGFYAPVTYRVLEDAIEGKAFPDDMPWETRMQQTLVELMAERLAVDAEIFAVQSDLTSADPDLDEFDGFLALPSNVYDHGGGVIGLTLFLETLKKLGAAYLQRMTDLAWFVGPRTALYIRGMFSERGTIGGDYYLTNGPAGETMMVLGIPVKVCATIPETLGAGLDRTRILLANPRDMVCRFHRGITLEWFRAITKRRVDIVGTYRMGVKIRRPAGAVYAKEVKVAI